jgi:hypothetical protein
MPIKPFKFETAGSLSAKQMGNLVRVWTTDSIYRASAKKKQAMNNAALSLGKVLGQVFPKTGFRLLEIDISKLKSWADLYKKIEGKYPESYSSTLAGLKSFAKEASGGHHKIAVSGFLVFEVEVSKQEWLFSVQSIYKMLPEDERKIEDGAGFSIREYLRQGEVVARPGTLRAAIRKGRVRLIGVAQPKESVSWLKTPKPIPNPNA